MWLALAQSAPAADLAVALQQRGAAWVQLLVTPFFRPFRLSTLVFTYVLPLIPLCTVWDGTVSLLRMYSPPELLALAARADPAGHYAWQAGKKRHWWGPQVTYLVGWPASR